MGRAIILKHILVKNLVTPEAEIVGSWSDELREQFSDKLFTTQIENLRSAGLWSQMSQGERDFIQAGVGKVTEQQRIDASWLAEPLVCLFWALGYMPKLPKYDQQSSPVLTQSKHCRHSRTANSRSLVRTYSQPRLSTDRGHGLSYGIGAVALGNY